MSDTVLTIGVGLMVIVNTFVVAPALVQLFFEALTVIVPILSEPVLFEGAVKMISPVPPVLIPIKAFEFVQLIAAPATLLVKGILTASPGQNDWSTTAATTGSGFTVIVNTMGGPLQPFLNAVTVTVPLIAEPVSFTGAVYPGMLPAPEAARPTAVLLFVHVYVSLPPVF